MLVSIITDLRQAARALARRPILSLVVVLTIGLGVGAAGAVFSGVESLLLRDPPFSAPDRLVRITSVRGNEDGGALSVPELDDLRALSIIEDAASYTDQNAYSATGFGTPEQLEATLATHNLFSLLGVEPLLGSTFPPNFDKSRNFGLLLSYDLWVRKFGSDPSIVGRGMTLDGSAGYTIYGVMPRGFNFPARAQIFRSIGISPDPLWYQRRDVRWHYVFARLRPGVTVAQAQAAVDSLARRLESEFPATNAALGLRVTPIADMYSAAVRPYVLLLLGSALVVLVVVGANITNLLLARALAQRRDVAMRVALGAGPSTIVRKFLAEGLLIGVGGALIGALVAFAGVRALGALIPITLPPWMLLEADASVGLFVAGTALLMTAAVAVALALRMSSPSFAALAGGGRGSTTGIRQRGARNALVVAEIALAIVLLTGGSLMSQSVWRLYRADLGFVTANALTFRTQLGWAAYDTFEERLAFHERVVARLRELPSVVAVTFDDNLPMSGQPLERYTARAEGQSSDEADRSPYVNLHAVGPDYFSVMGIDIRRGRAFDTRDRAGTAAVAVVSQRLADRLWPNRDPIGERLQLEGGAPSTWRTVIGVAEPVIHHAVERGPEYDAYEPYLQTPTFGAFYVIKTAGDPWSIAGAATAIIGELDPYQPYFDVQAFARRVDDRIWQPRVAAALIVCFATLATVLALVGLFGVLSYVVQQQTRDIGVRLALGATRRVIAADVFRSGLRLATLGAGVGLAVAFVLSQSLNRLLYGVSSVDALTFTCVPLLVLVVAAAACYLPARRACGVDPTVALRGDG